MSGKEATYLLDSNILIAAKRLYYAFDLCPGFWGALLQANADGRVFSTQRVLAELAAGKDDLLDWATKVLPKEFFIDDSETDVVSEFAPMMAWVQSESFIPAAKQNFASDTDGWLIACAKAKDFTLVTEEQYRSAATKRIPMPNVCKEFDVEHVTTFEMLRDLGARFVFSNT